MLRFTVCLLVACSSAPKASPPATPPPATKQALGDHGIDVANLRAVLPPYLESIGGGAEHRKLSGYVLIAQHDEPIVSLPFGFADRGTRRAPTADTSFRIGSVTKQFTAAAILRLEQDGKLSTSDKVSKHLPAYRGPAKDVTIHQLLTHTAGVPSYTSDLSVLAKKAQTFTVDQLLALFADKPLDFTPGEKFAYSNSGYAILGAIIEHASGKPYGRYLDEALFKPAKLTRTVVGDAIGDRDRAEGYQIVNGEHVPAEALDMSLPYAAGAIRSTANDLARWHRALQGDTILGAPARAKLYRADLEGYAYGWVATKVKERETVWHNGAIDGFHAIVWRILDADLVVVVLSNTLEVSTDPIGAAAIRAALGEQLEPIPVEKPGTVDAAVVARLVGSYALTDEGKARLTELKAPAELADSIATMTITAGPTGLIAKPKGQDPIELVPSSDGSFYDADHDIRLRFDLAAQGPVQNVTLIQGKLSLGFRRK